MAGVVLSLCHERSNAVYITTCLNMISVYKNPTKFTYYAVYYCLLYYNAPYCSIKCCVINILFDFYKQGSNTRAMKTVKVLMCRLLRRFHTNSEKRLLAPSCPFVCLHVSTRIRHSLFIFFCN